MKTKDQLKLEIVCKTSLKKLTEVRLVRLYKFLRELLGDIYLGIVIKALVLLFTAIEGVLL